MQILIIIIGIFLIAFNYKAIKKEKGSFNNTLNRAENNINDSSIEIGQMRREFAETVLELQQDIESLKDEIKQLKANKSETTKIPKDNDIKNDNINKSEDNGSESNNIKINEVGKFLKDGLSVEEIAEKLAIGKGEVLLIKELFVK